MSVLSSPVAAQPSSFHSERLITPPALLRSLPSPRPQLLQGLPGQEVCGHCGRGGRRRRHRPRAARAQGHQALPHLQGARGRAFFSLAAALQGKVTAGHSRRGSTPSATALHLVRPLVRVAAGALPLSRPLSGRLLQADIMEFLRSAQVNRGMAAVIQKLQADVEAARKEAAREAAAAAAGACLGGLGWG